MTDFTSLEQLRSAAPSHLRKLSDIELVKEYSNFMGADFQQTAEYFGMDTGRSSGDFTAGIAMGTDQLQGMLYGAGAAVADQFGAEGIRDAALRKVQQQQLEGELARNPLTPQRIEDVQGLGDFIDYAQGQFGQQVPIMGGLVGASLVNPAAALGLGYGMGVGSLYNESVEGGDPNAAAALLGGIPYAAAETLVPLGLGKLIRTGGFSGGMLTRGAKGLAAGGTTEAATELVQTEMEMAMRDDLTPEEKASRRLNAAVSGALVGGGMSGATAAIRAPRDLTKKGDDEVTTTEETTQAPVQQPAATTTEQVDLSVAPVPESAAEAAPDVETKVSAVTESTPVEEALVPKTPTYNPVSTRDASSGKAAKNQWTGKANTYTIAQKDGDTDVERQIEITRDDKGSFKSAKIDGKIIPMKQLKSYGDVNALSDNDLINSYLGAKTDVSAKPATAEATAPLSVEQLSNIEIDSVENNIGTAEQLAALDDYLNNLDDMAPVADNKLEAAVSGRIGKVVEKITAPSELIRGVVLAMKDFRTDPLVRIFKSGQASVDDSGKRVAPQLDAEATAKYGGQIKNIHAKILKVAELSSLFNNKQTNAIRNKDNVVKAKQKDGTTATRYEKFFRPSESAKSGEIKVIGQQLQQAMQELVDSVGGEKNLEAIVNGFKTVREQRKSGKGTGGSRKLSEKFAAIGKQGTDKDGGVKTRFDFEESLDTLLSSSLAAYKDGYLGEMDYVRPRETRNLRNKGGRPNKLINAKVRDLATDYGKREPSILALLEAIAGWKGTASVKAKALGEMLRRAFNDPIDPTTGKSQISDHVPTLKFLTEEGQNPYYDVQSNTIYLRENASQEEILHEALHAATAWYIYQNPNSPEVVALQNALEEIRTFVATGQLSNTSLSPSQQDKAMEVYNKLNEIATGDSETASLDAIAELVAYGNTLNDFVELTKQIRSSASGANQTFLQKLKHGYNTMVRIIARMLGIEDTVAENIFAATTSILHNSIYRNTLDTGRKLPNSRLEMAIDSRDYVDSLDQVQDTDAYGRATNPVLDQFKTKATNLGIVQSFMFNGWWDKLGKAAGTQVNRIAAAIVQNYPRTESLIRLFNARFGILGDVSDALDQAKLDRGIAARAAEDLAHFFTTQPADAVVKMAKYLDGDTNALEGMSERYKVAAEGMQKIINDMIQQLPPTLRANFANKKFSELLIYPESDKTMSSSQPAASKLASMIKNRGTKFSSVDFIDNPDLHVLNRFGEVDTSGTFYAAEYSNPDGSPYTVFVNKAKVDDGSLDALVNNGMVDTSTEFRIIGDPNEAADVRVAQVIRPEQLVEQKQAEKFAGAITNTVAALSNQVTATALFDNLARMGMKVDENGNLDDRDKQVFNSVDELNQWLRKHSDEGQFTAINPRDKSRIVALDDSIMDRNGKIRDLKQRNRLRRSNRWVIIPEGTGDNPRYGALSGKIVRSNVFMSMYDMADREQFMAKVPGWLTTMRWFKKSKTVYNIGTQITNVMSNVTLMIMHDLPVSNLAPAIKLLTKYQLAPKSLTRAEAELMEAFLSSGAMLGTFSSVELKNAIYQEIADATKSSDGGLLDMIGVNMRIQGAIARAAEKTKRTAGDLDNFFTEAYAAGDNMFRLAAFATRYNQLMEGQEGPMSADQVKREAGKFARQAFLDYDNDAPAVKAMRQTAFPFISWTYAMVPMLGKLIATKPWKVANVLAVYHIMDMVAASLADEDDEFRKKLGPEANERMFNMPFLPRMHIRVPFLGDDDNPVYFRWGDYFPLASTVKGLPTSFLGQSWWPGGFTPSGPATNMIAAVMFGIDPFTGKSLDKVTNSDFENLLSRMGVVTDQFLPSMVSSSSRDKYMKALEGEPNKLGIVADPSFLFFSRFIGLKLVDYNTTAEAYYKNVEAQSLIRDYSSAIKELHRKAAATGAYDYEELNNRTKALREELMRKVEEIREGK